MVASASLILVAGTRNPGGAYPNILQQELALSGNARLFATTSRPSHPELHTDHRHQVQDVLPPSFFLGLNTAGFLSFFSFLLPPRARRTASNKGADQLAFDELCFS